jgi:putative inorganic carbon (hco3(-)) transporter
MERLAFICRIPDQPSHPAAVATTRQPAVRSAVEPERDGAAYFSMLAFLAVLLFRPQDEIPGLHLLHLADVFGVLALVTLLCGRLGRGLAPSRMTPEVAGVLAFAAFMIGTVPLSTWPGGSLAVFSELFVKILIILVVMMNTLTSPERIQRVIVLLAVGATYVATRAVADYARGVNLVEGHRVGGAISGLFGNPNDLALNLVTFLPLAIAVGLRREHRVLRLVALGGIPFIAAAIVFSKSRGGLLGLLAMLAVLLYQMRRLRPAIAVLILTAGLAALPALPASFTERMATIVNPEHDTTGSREARKTVMREAFATFIAHPFTGVGAGQFQNYGGGGGQMPSWRQTHNAPLQVAAELGVAGLGAFLFLLWTAFRACWVALRNTRGSHSTVELNAAMTLAALSGWFVCAMFASVAYYWTFYLLLGLAGSIRDVSASQPTRAATRRPASREAA